MERCKDELQREFYIKMTKKFGRTKDLLINQYATEIWQKPSAKLEAGEISAKSSRKSPFTLSWSHYVLLLTIKNPDERSFYEIEATQAC